MLAKELITDNIPPLKTSDTGTRALDWMDEFRVSHLPIVNNNELLGVISEVDILDLNDSEQPLGNHKLSLHKSFVYENQHIYEIIKLIDDQKLTIVPILDANDHYIGMVSLHEIVKTFAKMAALDSPGGIIILELGVRDYSLSEIARIVESNDAKILSSYVTSHVESTKVEVTLKINKTDLTRIIATFDRFSYNIKASYHQDEFFEDLRERYDSFIHYLNI
ncbi:MAG: CBS domain-containing protein [Bacteroidia bacterium]|nr:CBS domain-containing protein [Bacteroidia bacterium]